MNRMKKLTTFLLCLSLALTAALPAAAGEVPAMQTGTETTAIGMPNPFTDCKDAQEAAAITGFPFTLPEPPAGYTGPAGSGDNSGDYNAYPEESRLELGGIPVTAKGDGELYYLILWEKDGYSFSLRFPEGIAGEELEAVFS